MINDKFRKYLVISVTAHIVGAITILLSAYFSPKAPSSQRIDLQNSSLIKAKSDADLIESVSVSENELAIALKEYDKKQIERQNLHSKQIRESENVEKELNARIRQLENKEKELKRINDNIKRMNLHAKRLKEEQQLKENKEKKKRAELEKKAHEARLKHKKEEERREAALKERKRQQEIKEKLEKQKIANKKALEEIAIRNKAAEERELSLIRGKYEQDIHGLLYDAWMLPYDRKNVNCSVSLSLTKSGRIEGFKYLTDCPSDYKHMIDLAIERVGRLPSVGDARIFRSVEVVNFIDRL